MAPALRREQLPALPNGANVTAWDAGASILSRVTPRQAMILLLHVSWLRWHEYAAALKDQVEEGKSRGSAARGLVGHKTSASSVVGSIYPISEEVRALVRLEGQERDRCAQLARQAHEMGLSGDDW